MNQNDFELSSIGLKKSNCAFAVPEMDSKGGVLNITFQFDGVVPAGPDKKRFELIVAVSVRVNGINENKESVLLIETRHHGGFKLLTSGEVDFNDEELMFHLSKQILPIARSHVTGLLNDMGLRNIYLPWSMKMDGADKA